MTTAMGDIRDLFRILDDDPGQLEELRRRVVGEELLNLPERFERFAEEQHGHNERMDRFVEEQHRHNERMDRFVEEQHRHNERMDRFVEEQHRHNERMDRFVEEQRRINDEVRRDLGQLRGNHAREAAIRRSLLIALRMGLQRERVLTDDDLMAMARSANARDIAPGAIESFISADLVMEATDGDGQTVYIAMEVSYTANRQDTGRATRNAEFLTRFTGQPARAAVASVRNDPEIADAIASGRVYWHEIRDRDLEPE